MSRIVIIGAGMGGWGAARALARSAALDDVEVVLVDRRPHHEFPPYYYEVATGKAQGRPEDCERVLASGACVNLNTFDRITRETHVQFVWDEVVAIDRRTRIVRTRAHDDLPFDALILALGAETAYYGITGLREHAIPLKSIGDALRIRRCILDLVERARRGSTVPARVVIGGGGASGVEFTAELGNYLSALVRAGDLRREDCELSLVEGGSRILSMFPEELSRAALRRLHGYGVRVYLDALVQHVGLGRVTVAPRPLKDGEAREQLLCGFAGETCTIDADCIVWTGGVAFPALPKDAGFPVDAKNRVIVDEHLLVDGERCIFALGDCAAFTPAGDTRPLPPLASIAVRQAPVAAANALACIAHRPMRRYRHRTLPVIVPLGGRFAALVYGRIAWVGRSPWYLHALIALQYFVGAFGVFRGVRIWVRGAKIYTKND